MLCENFDKAFAEVLNTYKDVIEEAPAETWKTFVEVNEEFDQGKKDQDLEDISEGSELDDSKDKKPNELARKEESPDNCKDDMIVQAKKKFCQRKQGSKNHISLL